MKTTGFDANIGSKAIPTLKINGKSVDTSLSDRIEGISYVDPASGESDKLDITFSNIDKAWINKWFPRKGDRITVSLALYNWVKAGEKSIYTVGTFTLDDYTFSGRPLIAKYSALSVPAKSAFKTCPRSKTWKSISIREVARQIASKYKLKLVYEAETIRIKSVEQSTKTDCEFLYDLCKKYGLGMKVYRAKIIIYSKEKYEAKRSVKILSEEDFMDWEYNDSLYGTYTGATMKYTNAGNSKEYKASVGSGSRILNVNEKADSLADAKLKAIAKVNEENESMTTLNVKVIPNPKYVATANITVKDMGKMNGKYSITKVTHSIGGGKYSMSLEMRKIQKRIKK